MIGVNIHINGHPLLSVTATNTLEICKGMSVYLTDAGNEVLHDPQDGAVVLAIKLLKTIKEQRKDGVS